MTKRAQKSLVNSVLRKIESRFLKDFKEKIVFKYLIDEEEGDFMIYHTNEHFNKLITELDRTKKEENFFTFYSRQRTSIVNKGIYPYFYLKNDLFSFHNQFLSGAKPE